MKMIKELHLFSGRIFYRFNIFINYTRWLCDMCDNNSNDVFIPRELLRRNAMMATPLITAEIQ